MHNPQYTKPFYIFFLTMPAGLSQGFITVALPYLFTIHGFGVGIGGGAGLWLATHYSLIIAGIVLCAASAVFALVVLLIKELAAMGKDIFAMLKVPVTLLVIFSVFLPIGTGAAANLWSASGNLLKS